MKVKEIVKRYDDYMDKLNQIISGEFDIEEGVSVFQDYVEFMNTNVEYVKVEKQ